MKPSIKTIEQHFDEYCRDGYTIFKQFMPAECVDAIRQAIDPEFRQRFIDQPELTRTKIDNLVSHDTLASVMTDQLLNPSMLDFAELVMGPFVQLDSFEITGYPSSPLVERNQVAGWHRDAFNVSDMWQNHPGTKDLNHRPYTPPTACNCLIYLQDMNEDSGPLRLVPGSHLDYTIIAEDKRRHPHPREQMITSKSGDMVFTHNEILHSGSVNTASSIRYFVSIYVQRFGLPHRDRFDSPRIETLMQAARARNDRRTLRLFGEDPLFAEREQAAWKQMIAEDQAALRE